MRKEFIEDLGLELNKYKSDNMRVSAVILFFEDMMRHAENEEDEDCKIK